MESKSLLKKFLLIKENANCDKSIIIAVAIMEINMKILLEFNARELKFKDFNNNDDIIPLTR